jgi:hypothetical protein
LLRRDGFCYGPSTFDELFDKVTNNVTSIRRLFDVPVCDEVVNGFLYNAPSSRCLVTGIRMTFHFDSGVGRLAHWAGIK